MTAYIATIEDDVNFEDHLEIDGESPSDAAERFLERHDSGTGYAMETGTRIVLVRDAVTGTTYRCEVHAEYVPSYSCFKVAQQS